MQTSSMHNQMLGKGTWDDGEQVVPAAAHAAGVALNELLQRDGQLLLHRARRVHVPADAEQLRAWARAQLTASAPPTL